MKQTALDRKLPLQFDLVQGDGDDSAEIQKSNPGVPTVNLVVPVRYTHAHNGVMNRQDFEQMVALVVAMLNIFTYSIAFIAARNMVASFAQVHYCARRVGLPPIVFAILLQDAARRPSAS